MGNNPSLTLSGRFGEKCKCVPFDIYGVRGDHNINACNGKDRWEPFDRGSSHPLTGDSGPSGGVKPRGQPFWF